MKINELVKEVNSYFLSLKAIKRDDGILIISSNDEALLLVPEKATNFMEVHFYVDNQGMYFTKADREKLSALIDEFLETPIKERFLEKKYRLRWIDSNDGRDDEFIGPETYLGRSKDNGVSYWTTFQKFGAETFTEKELQQLKINNPRFAPAIDAMKEPVEDD